MTTPVVGNRTKAVLCEEKQLGVPSVGAQRPAVRKGYDRALAPVFVVDPRPIFHCNRAHLNFSFPYLGGCCREGDSCRGGCPLSSTAARRSARRGLRFGGKKGNARVSRERNKKVTPKERHPEPRHEDALSSAFE